MKQSISTHQTSNYAGDNGLNGLDKHTNSTILQHARKRYPLMPTWRVYRFSYESPLQILRSDNRLEATK